MPTVRRSTVCHTTCFPQEFPHQLLPPAVLMSLDDILCSVGVALRAKGCQGLRRRLHALTQMDACDAEEALLDSHGTSRITANVHLKTTGVQCHGNPSTVSEYFLRFLRMHHHSALAQYLQHYLRFQAISRSLARDAANPRCRLPVQ